jgi:hypothetical protein
MDQFKKHLFTHRDELDVEKPPPAEVWQRVQQQVQTPVKPLWPVLAKWMAAAAIVVAMGMAVYWFWFKPAPQSNVAEVKEESMPAKPDSLSLPQVNNDGMLTDSINDHTPALAPEQKPAKKARDNRPPAKVKPQSPVDVLEENYATMINLQLKKLERTPIYAESPGYFHMFKKQWYDLQKDEEKVKDDIENYGLSDQGIDQLIRLYQQKMKLLKQLQAEINKMNNRVKSHPVVQKKKPSYLRM